MDNRSVLVPMLVTAVALAGCASTAGPAIRAYAATAEQQAEVMLVAFDACLKSPDKGSRDAACGAVRNSIEVYRQSAAELARLDAKP